MHFSNRLIVLSFIILSLVHQRFAKVPKTVEVEVCPTFCYCDLFGGLNRANCSGRRLINSNVELPPSVEILDLSDNDITILDNNCFQSFIFLKKLNISHNDIHTIYLDTFSPLRSITSIDLSHNRLEYVDERIFETNRKLERLNLSDNKFMSLRNKPLLRSASLRSLNLRNAQISHIYPELFDALPNLRELDVSANLMIALNMVAFRSLKRLEYLNLNANRWNCDAGLLNALKLLQKRGIQVELIDCNMVIGNGGAAVATAIRKEVDTKSETMTMATTTTTKKNERFERMRMFDGPTNGNFNTLPVGSAKEVDENREPAKEDTSAEFYTGINIGNIWHLISLDDIYGGDDDDQEDAEPNSHEIHSHKLKCKTSCDELCFQYKRCLSDKVNVEKSIAGTYTVNDLNFVFVMGIALGITFVICIISCVMCARRCCEARKKHDTIEYHITENAVAHVARPLPPQTVAPLIPPPRSRTSRRRRQRASDLANQTNALVSRDYATSQGRDNFFARLFGRPARHQYYRTINQNTATLIRRLSRSNLFNSRLSQHFAAEGREQNDRAATTQTSPTAPSSPGSDDERFYDEIFMGTETVVAPEQPAVAEFRNRPETPPPSYGDVVVNVRKQ